MTTYTIKNAFTLKSANNKLMQPGGYFSSTTDEQEAELKLFAVDGSCSPVPTSAPAKVTDKPLDSMDDLSVVPGIGQKIEKKLNDAGIKTQADLKTAMLGVERTEDMKAILGLSYDKILAYFTATK